MSIIRVSDKTDSARRVVVDGSDVAPVVGQWLAADAGMFDGISPNVAGLARALAAADWSRVHAIAEHLSMDVEVLLP